MPFNPMHLIPASHRNIGKHVVLLSLLQCYFLSSEWIFLHMYMNVAFDHIWVISGSIIRAGTIYNISRSKNLYAKNLDNLPFRNLPLLLNHILVHYSCNKTLYILFFSHPWYNGNDLIFCSKSHNLWMLSRECNNWRYVHQDFSGSEIDMIISCFVWSKLY